MLKSVDHDSSLCCENSQMKKSLQPKTVSDLGFLRVQTAKKQKQKRIVPYLPERFTWVDEYCLNKIGCISDFKVEWDVTRYMLAGKFFVIIMQTPKKEPIITLKLEPNYGRLLRLNHKEVIPGYHMNKLHWNSIFLESEFPDDLLEELIDESYTILLHSLSRKKQQEILNGSTLCGQ
ncbi:MAG: MmcQ/YjbR family DNA-binding protein [Thermoguttaceae bacterium]